MEMANSWLVQRLKRPIGKKGRVTIPPELSYTAALASPKAFPAEFTELRRQIWELDYMGSAEFEFGAIPQCLRHIAAHLEEYEAFTFTIQKQIVQRPIFENAITVKASEKVKFGVLGPKDIKDEIKARIRTFAKGDVRLKERPRISNSVFPRDDHDRDYGGWLEMENGFFFFTDMVMFEETCALWGKKVP